MLTKIRDPIHGSIHLNTKELALVDHPAFQRLRNIKQLGFAEQAFPGATHTRYSHSLGAMAMATRIFDSLFKPGDLDESFRLKMRQAVRLAMLLHDLGHPPLSHCAEMLMPSKKSLGLEGGGQATHEDYTFILIRNSSFSKLLEQLFEDEGLSPELITSLDFKVNKISYQPILKQIVSSECDADRMDYLQRDSMFCGVNYGRFDSDWLIGNLVPIQREQEIYLAIKSKGMFSFEDFLLSRYHMFASVYLHHTPVVFEKMLQRYFAESDDAPAIPSDPEEYILTNDLDFQRSIRDSNNSWAKRISSRNPYSLVADELSESEFQNLTKYLESEKIDFIQSRSKNAISKYFESSAIPLYVLTKRGEIVPLEKHTTLFNRYPKPIEINRIYVAPENKEKVLRLSKTR